MIEHADQQRLATTSLNHQKREQLIAVSEDLKIHEQGVTPRTHAPTRKGRLQPRARSGQVKRRRWPRDRLAHARELLRGEDIERRVDKIETDLTNLTQSTCDRSISVPGWRTSGASTLIRTAGCPSSPWCEMEGYGAAGCG